MSQVKRLRLGIPLLLIACAAAEAQAPVVLADGRVDGPMSAPSGWDTRPSIVQAADAARAYWRGQDPDYEEEAGVFGVAEGAFTAPGTRQHAVLYLMSPWPRCCPKMGLAVVEGDRLVRNVAFTRSAQALAAVPDLDGDGRDELVTRGWFGMGGQESGSMTLLSFGAEGVVEWGGASISESDCAGSGASGSIAARVTAVPGPTFTVEPFAQPSCEDPTWQAVGGPEPLTLVPFNASGYVELPVTGSGAAGSGAGGSGGVRQERGRLAPGDGTLSSGEFKDEYAVEGRRGQTLVIDLRSTDFDPYLILALPSGDQLDNDDFEGDRTRSQISTVLTATGTYHVLVTSYAAGETGAYELTIQLGGD